MFENTTLARPYAKAAFAYAKDSGQFAAWSESLQVAAELLKHPDFCKLVGNPRISPEEMVSLIAEFGSKWSESQKNFLRILASNRRMKLLPEIFEQFECLRAEEEHLLHAELLSALPVTQALQDKIGARIKQKYQCEVSLSVRLVPELIGGAILKIGDKVIDGSIRGHLTGLANALGV